MAELTTQLKEDYAALMECFWAKKSIMTNAWPELRNSWRSTNGHPITNWKNGSGTAAIPGFGAMSSQGAQDRRRAAPKELETMKLLLASGLSPNSSRSLSGTSEISVHGECSAPLNVAIANGDSALVKLYLTHGADPNTMSDGVPPALCRRDKK